LTVLADGPPGPAALETAEPLPESAAPERRRFILLLGLVNLAFVPLDALAPWPSRAAVLGGRVALSALLLGMALVLARLARAADVRGAVRGFVVTGVLGLGIVGWGAGGLAGPYCDLLALLPLVLAIAVPDDPPALLLAGAAIVGVGAVIAWSLGAPASQFLLWTTGAVSSILFARYGVILHLRSRSRERELGAAHRVTQDALSVMERQHSMERAERELLWERLEGLSQASNEIVVLVDPEGRIAQANDRASEGYGYPLDELLGMSVTELRAPEVAAGLEGARAREAKAARYTTLHRRRDGSVFPVEVSSRAFQMAGRCYLQCLVRDLTEERRARAVIDHQAMLLENLHDAVIGLDADVRITSWNASAERIYGWPREEVIGYRIEDVLPAAFVDGSSHADVVRRANSVGPVTVEVRRQNRAGAWVDVESTLVPLRASGEAIGGYVVVSRDISRRKRAELALRASQARMNRILETSNEGVWIVDARGITQFANARIAELYGLEQREMLGHSFVELSPAAARDAARADLAALQRGEAGRCELRLPRPDGSTVTLLFSRTVLRDEQGKVEGGAAFFVDLTEQRRVEQELQQSNRLEAVGRLAAGVAHEINTPIQYIGDNTTFLKDAFTALRAFVERARAAGTDPATLERTAAELDLDYLLERVPGTLDRTLEGVERVATIVRAMKEFAHQDQREVVPSDLNRALSATLEVARNEYKYVADPKVELGPLPLVTCRPGDLNQVFLNLIVNAAHAMAEANQGTGRRGVLGVRTSVSGAEVLVEVSDTGTGIPAKIHERIFEPFFTTKEVGRGTGQGLALARSIVTQHGGQLTFTTAMGKGTTFQVRLPVEPRDARAQRTAP
jgi:PAS domain S-box-containing protein